MLTPRFTIDQDETFVIVKIYAPFTNLSETEIFMDETDFRFFSKPYFLRLHLPGEIEENDKASGVYDADTSSFIVKAPKKNPGEKFEGLELLTELLRPRGAPSVAATQKIEVISDSTDQANAEENNGEEEEDDEVEWYYEQEFPSEETERISLGTNKAGYGFGFKRVDVFARLLEECQEVLDVKNPDSRSWEERRTDRLSGEEKDFDSDHYLCDLFESGDIEYMWNNKSAWSKDLDPEDLELNEDERDRLISLPAKLDTKFPKDLTQSVYFGLIDILYAYLYDHRTTDGEHNSESGWTISKLCATLSCCEKYNSLKETIVTCVRRSLMYPLFRHWKLSKAVLGDVSHVLNLGRLSIVKILLSIIPIFNASEGRHIFNELYINQYVAWVQSVKPERLRSLAKSLDSAICHLSKADVGLELTELETAAKMVVAEEETRKHRSSGDDDDDSDDSDSENPEKEASVTSVHKSDVKRRVANDDSDDSDSEDSSSDSDSSDSGSSSSDVSSVISVKENICGSRVSEIDDKSSQEKSDKEIDVLESHFNEINLKSETEVTNKDIIPNENKTDRPEIKDKASDALSKTLESINLS